LFHIRYFDAALQAVNRAIEIDPSYPDAWHSKAVLLGNEGRYDEALEAARRAQRLGYRDAARTLAILEAERGKSS
jgi:tetratricopeptide (TPR) repeat protein